MHTLGIPDLTLHVVPFWSMHWCLLCSHETDFTPHCAALHDDTHDLSPPVIVFPLHGLFSPLFCLHRFAIECINNFLPLGSLFSFIFLACISTYSVHPSHASLFYITTRLFLSFLLSAIPHLRLHPHHTIRHRYHSPPTLIYTYNNHSPLLIQPAFLLVLLFHPQSHWLYRISKKEIESSSSLLVYYPHSFFLASVFYLHESNWIPCCSTIIHTLFFLPLAVVLVIFRLTKYEMWTFPFVALDDCRVECV